MDLFLTNMQFFASYVNWWTGVLWITCGLLWCFYQLFGLSFWRHPFNAEDLLVSKWWNDGISPNLFKWRNKWIYILVAWGWVHIQQMFILGWAIPLLSMQHVLYDIVFNCRSYSLQECLRWLRGATVAMFEALSLRPDTINPHRWFPSLFYSYIFRRSGVKSDFNANLENTWPKYLRKEYLTRKSTVNSGISYLCCKPIWYSCLHME